MKQLLMLIGLVLMVSGCLSSAPQPPRYWNLRYTHFPVQLNHLEPAYGVVRLGRLVVRAPYDTQALTVVRADDSLAFDGYNSFAASPATLLRELAMETVEQMKYFTAVVDANSSAESPYVLETIVREFALDCRGATRQAVVDVEVTLLKGREVVKIAAAHFAESAESGDYGRAFSAAFSQALVNAVKQL